MLTRNFASARPGADGKLDRTIEALKPQASSGPGDTGARAAPPYQPMPGSGPRPATGGRTLSIIGNDLTIVGQGLRIVTKGALQVDGKVEGDVVGVEVIIGEKGSVTGVISGESVIVHGEVSGTVRAINVLLKSSARVEGDVHHRTLQVDQGAHLEARVRRPSDESELTPVLE